jgi:methionyl-tRNA formyltransferase
VIQRISKNDLKIVFFGTPDFAVCALKKIIETGYNVIAVVTAPDKPAGRGYQLQMSAVKKAAIELELPILQPTNLKSEDFITELKSLNADIQIVIAFRMLPEIVWNMPQLGTFNLHASYLPNYRGAAPINWAIINGEKQTGVTTFFLKQEIDTGDLILREKTEILPNETVGELYERLMNQGAKLVTQSLDLICSGNIQLTQQESGEFPHAPKIFDEHCKINWHKTATEIFNQVRGLSPYPGAYTIWNEKKLKLFKIEILNKKSDEIGLLEINSNKEFIAHCSDLQIKIIDLQLEGKKRMSIHDFINGLKM